MLIKTYFIHIIKIIVLRYELTNLDLVNEKMGGCEEVRKDIVVVG